MCAKTEKKMQVDASVYYYIMRALVTPTFSIFSISACTHISAVTCTFMVQNFCFVYKHWVARYGDATKMDAKRKWWFY